jgi:hypothetical protein
MPIEVETKDCTQLSDAELAEMADLCADGPHRFEVGLLSKQVEAWVLVTTGRENGKLRGYGFCTLERIGGTPSVLIGLATIKRTAKRDSVLKALITDQFRRAVLAFPDEDVLIGTRISDPGALEAFKSLHDIVPRPDHKANGEERAWGRRLAKRFGVDSTTYDDRSFVITGDGSVSPQFDHGTLKPEKLPEGLIELLAPLDVERGDSLVVHGWAKAEDLEKLL